MITPSGEEVLGAFVITVLRAELACNRVGSHSAFSVDAYPKIAALVEIAVGVAWLLNAKTCCWS